MKKTLCAILAVAALGAGLVSCNKKAEEGSMTVESKTCDFSFECPENWLITFTDGMLCVTNPEDISKANVTGSSFYHNSESTTALEYWQVYKEQLSETYPSTVFEETEVLELGGQNTAHTAYTVAIGDEVFDCETVLIIYGDKAYTMTLTQGAKNDANAENYNDHSDEFAKIIKTFRIK